MLAHRRLSIASPGFTIGSAVRAKQSRTAGRLDACGDGASYGGGHATPSSVAAVGLILIVATRLLALTGRQGIPRSCRAELIQIMFDTTNTKMLIS